MICADTVKTSVIIKIKRIYLFVRTLTRFWSSDRFAVWGALNDLFFFSPHLFWQYEELVLLLVTNAAIAFFKNISEVFMYLKPEYFSLDIC